jgi:hypothetical protein
MFIITIYILIAAGCKFIEPVLTMLLFKQTKGNLCGPAQTGQYSKMLQAENSGDQNLVGAIFSSPLQTGPQAHLSKYTRRASLFPGIKRPLYFFDQPPSSGADVKSGGNYTSTFLLGRHGLFYDEFTFTFTFTGNLIFSI